MKLLPALKIDTFGPVLEMVKSEHPVFKRISSSVRCFHLSGYHTRWSDGSNGASHFTFGAEFGDDE